MVVGQEITRKRNIHRVTGAEMRGVNHPGAVTVEVEQEAGNHPDATEMIGDQARTQTGTEV